MGIGTMVNTTSYDETPITNFFRAIPNALPRYPSAKRLIEEAEYHIFLRSLEDVSLTMPKRTKASWTPGPGPIRPTKLQERFNPILHKFPGKCPPLPRQRRKNRNMDMNAQHYLPSNYVYPFYPAIPMRPPVQALNIKKEEDEQAEFSLNRDLPYTGTPHDAIPLPTVVVKTEEPADSLLLFKWTERSLTPKMPYLFKVEQPEPEPCSSSRRIPARQYPKYARQQSVLTQGEI